MRSSVIAIVLCISAAAAGAQCIAQAPVSASTRPGAEVTLIKTSSAATRGHTEREQALPVDDGVPTLGAAAPASKPGDKPAHRQGSSMLLAAVALMSGIALRRFHARS